MKLWVFAIMLLALMNTACSVFGVRTVESLKYSVVEKQGKMEIRQYDPYIEARTVMGESFDGSQNSGFRVLADYIFGNNKSKQKIAMTAPVMRKEDSEKIAMTAPVLMKPGQEGSWVMSFSMPSKYKMDDLPDPVDERVELREVDSKFVAAFRFTGFWDDEKVQKKGAELKKWLETQGGYTVVSEVQFAGYDPPWTIPFLRRNEVLFELQKN